jgi:hypothetical protein
MEAVTVGLVPAFVWAGAVVVDIGELLLRLLNDVRKLCRPYGARVQFLGLPRAYALG